MVLSVSFFSVPPKRVPKSPSDFFRVRSTRVSLPERVTFVVTLLPFLLLMVDLVWDDMMLFFVLVV